MKEGGLVLVVDDEIQIRRYLQISLEKAGYNVIAAESGEEGIARTTMSLPDIIILDIGLPDIDGHTFVCRVREWSKVPIIVLSVRDSEKEKVRLLDSGADDYLTKPFSMNELLARIRVALRHKIKAETSLIFTGNRLEINYEKRTVMIDNEKIRLTPKEYHLLKLLSQNSGKVLTQNALLKELWGTHYQDESQYLRFYIMQLRKKIEKNPKHPCIIVTEPGVGYRFIDEDE